MSYLLQAVFTIVQIIFDMYMILVMVRFLFQLVRADFYNPLSQGIVMLTNPPLKILRRIIPGYAGIDIACIVLLFLLQGLKLILLTLIYAGTLPTLPALFILSLANLIQLCAYIYMFLIFVVVVISWINPGAYNHMTVLIYQLTDPLLRAARRRIPAMGGLDFSPMIVILAIFLVLSLVVAPLLDWGNSLNGFPRRIL